MLLTEEKVMVIWNETYQKLTCLERKKTLKVVKI